METHNDIETKRQNTSSIRAEIIRTIRQNTFLVDEELVDRLSEAICEIIPAGVALDYKPTYTTEQIIEIIEMRKKYNIRPGLFEIMAQVCNKHEVSTEEMRGRSRSGTMVRARLEFMRRSSMRGYTHKEIAAELERDRSTITQTLIDHEFEESIR